MNTPTNQKNQTNHVSQVTTAATAATAATATPTNGIVSPSRAKEIAAVFIKYAEKYTGDILLPKDTIFSVTKDLKKIKVTGSELEQLDQRPYAYLSHDQASQSHWFMRRFRNSDGWRGF
jgi:hypothetical protein